MVWRAILISLATNRADRAPGYASSGSSIGSAQCILKKGTGGGSDDVARADIVPLRTGPRRGNDKNPRRHRHLSGRSFGQQDAFFLERVQQFIVRSDELIHTGFGQILTDGSHTDLQADQFAEYVPHFAVIGMQRPLRAAMIAKGCERFWRHGVNGIGTNQAFDVHHIRIGLVLCAGAGPKGSLHTHTPVLPFFKLRTKEYLSESS